MWLFNNDKLVMMMMMGRNLLLSRDETGKTKTPHLIAEVHTKSRKMGQNA